MYQPVGLKESLKVFIGFWLIVVLGFGITGCRQKENKVITGIRFERGNDSVWGNQFYIEVNDAEIIQVRYFPENSQDLEICDHVPITPEQWDAICLAVQKMELKEKRISVWQKLWKNRKLDGGEYKKLTVIWNEKEEILYQWADNQQSKELEALLEQLAAEQTPELHSDLKS